MAEDPKERFKRYSLSEKGKLARTKAMNRYNNTDGGLETRKKWRTENKEKVNEYGRDNKIRNTKGMLLTAAKRRAKLGNYEFSIFKEDITIPDVCPILGIPLYHGSHNKYNSPSLDKIIPEKGYIPGNVQVISWRANMLKNNATIDELEKIFNFLKNIK